MDQVEKEQTTIQIMQEILNQLIKEQQKLTIFDSKAFFQADFLLKLLQDNAYRQMILDLPMYPWIVGPQVMKLEKGFDSV